MRERVFAPALVLERAEALGPNASARAQEGGGEASSASAREHGAEA